VVIRCVLFHLLQLLFFHFPSLSLAATNQLTSGCNRGKKEENVNVQPEAEREGGSQTGTMEALLLPQKIGWRGTAQTAAARALPPDLASSRPSDDDEAWRGGSASYGLLCICRPRTTLLPATARRVGTASGEMAGGMSGGLPFIPARWLGA
jgi:hypothetical protein